MKNRNFLTSSDIRGLHEFQKKYNMHRLPYCRGDRGTYTRDGNVLELWSYVTNVMHAEIEDFKDPDGLTGKVAFVDVLWNEYSATTMNHINAFLRMLKDECSTVVVKIGIGRSTYQTHFTASEWKQLFCKEV